MRCTHWSITIKHPDGTIRTLGFKNADGRTADEVRAEITRQQGLFSDHNGKYYLPQGEITAVEPRSPNKPRPKDVEAEHKIDPVTPTLGIRTVVMQPKKKDRPFNE